MALSAAIVWEIEPAATHANDANGGGFKAGASGTDYTQGAGLTHIDITDLKTDGATTTVMVSATRNFVAADVGNLIHVVTSDGGGHAYTEWFEIISVASNKATVDRAWSAADNSDHGDAVAILGGALASIGGLGAIFKQTTTVASAQATAGMKAYIKGGTYNLNNTTVNTSNGPLDLDDSNMDSKSFYLKGYATDAANRDAFTGTRPLIDCNGQAPTTVIELKGTASENHVIAFLDILGDAGTSRNINGILGNSQSTDCVIDCIVRDCDGSYAFATIRGINCYALSCAATGFATSYVFGCLANACEVGFSGCVPAINCVAYNCTSDGFTGSYGIYTNCVSYNSTGNGFNETSARSAFLINCISYSDGGYSFNTSPETIIYNCASDGAASGRKNATTFVDLNAVTLTGDPFVDAANLDFRLNPGSADGRLCMGAGLDSYGQSAGLADIGAVFSPDFPAAANVLNTDTVNGASGTLTLPDAQNVLADSGQYGVDGTGSTPTLTLPGPGFVIEGSGTYGVAGTGSTPTYHAPDAAEVISTASFGAGGATAGTYDVSDVAAGNIVTGASIGGVAGNYPTTAATQDADIAAIEAAVLNTDGSDTVISLPNGKEATADTSTLYTQAYSTGGLDAFNDAVAVLNANKDEMIAANDSLVAYFGCDAGTAAGGGGYTYGDEDPDQVLTTADGRGNYLPIADSDTVDGGVEYGVNEEGTGVNATTIRAAVLQALAPQSPMPTFVRDSTATQLTGTAPADRNTLLQVPTGVPRVEQLTTCGYTAATKRQKDGADFWPKFVDATTDRLYYTLGDGSKLYWTDDIAASGDWTQHEVADVADAPFSTASMAVILAVVAEGNTIVAFARAAWADGEAAGAIFRSTDAGATWTNVQSMATGHVQNQMAVGRDGDKLAVGEYGGTHLARDLYYSDDLGATWTKIWTSPERSVGQVNQIHCAQFDPEETDELYFVTDGDTTGVWVLALSGGTWSLDRSILGGTMNPATGEITRAMLVGAENIVADGDTLWFLGGQPSYRWDRTTDSFSAIPRHPTPKTAVPASGYWRYHEVAYLEPLPYTLVRDANDVLYLGRMQYAGAGRPYASNDLGLSVSADEGATWTNVWRNDTGTGDGALGVYTVAGPCNGLMFFAASADGSTAVMFSMPVVSATAVEALRLEKAAINALPTADNTTFTGSAAGWTGDSSAGHHYVAPAVDATAGLHGNPCLELQYGPADGSEAYFAQYNSDYLWDLAVYPQKFVVSLWIRGENIPGQMKVIASLYTSNGVSVGSYEAVPLSDWQRWVIPGAVTVNDRLLVQILIQMLDPSHSITAEEMAAVRLYVDAIQVIADDNDWPSGLSFHEYGVSQAAEYAVVPLAGAKSLRFNWRPGCAWNEIGADKPIATIYGSYGTKIALHYDAAASKIGWTDSLGIETLCATAIEFHHYDEIGLCLTLDAGTEANELSISSPFLGVQHVTGLNGLKAPALALHLNQNAAQTTYGIGHYYGVKTFDSVLTEAQQHTELALAADTEAQFHGFAPSDRTTNDTGAAHAGAAAADAAAVEAIAKAGGSGDLAAVKAKTDTYPVQVGSVKGTTIRSMIPQGATIHVAQYSAWKTVAGGALTFEPLLDESGNAISLADKAVKITFALASAPKAKLFEYTTAGGQVTIGGAGNNVVSLQADATNNTQERTLRLEIWNTTDSVLVGWCLCVVEGALGPTA